MHTPSSSFLHLAAGFLKRLGAVFIGLLIACLFIEIILHFYNPFQFRVKGNQIVLPRNKRSVIQNNRVQKLDPVIVHTTNSLGFRGQEPPGISQDKFLPLVFDKYLTIFAVGGSTTECYFLSDGNTWPEVLGDLLQKDLPKVWVNNAGFVGHTTYGHLILMRDVIAPLHPDVVLFLIGVNDVSITQYSPTYDAKIMNGGRFRQNGQEKSSSQGNSFCFSTPGCFIRSLADVSEAVNLGLNLYRNYQASQAVPGRASPSMTVTGDFDEIQENLLKYTHRQIPEAQKIIATVNLESDSALQGYHTRVRQLIEVSRANDIEPVLITQPVLYGQGIDDVTGVNLETIEIEPGSNGLIKWGILEQYNDVVRQLGKENNVLVIDLARKLPKSSRNYYDFVHYTNAGAREVAEILYAELLPFLKSKTWDTTR